MESELSVIRARSRKEAMDWSVVLLSQGIEGTIQRNEEDVGWSIVVEPQDHARAVEVLRLYHQENRGRGWVQKIPWSELVFDVRSVVWFALLAAIFGLAENGFDALTEKGMMDSHAVRAGEWWRLFTATMLHANLPHLLSNVTIGIVFLGLAMATYGPGLALLCGFLSGGAGNVLALWLYPEPHRGLGASGMVMGALGLLAAHTFSMLRLQMPDRQLLIRSVFSSIFLLVLLGFDPSSDVIAHLGGFICGAALGAGMSMRIGAPAEKVALNTISGIVCGAIAALSWYLALRH